MPKFFHRIGSWKFWRLAFKCRGLAFKCLYLAFMKLTWIGAAATGRLWAEATDKRQRYANVILTSPGSDGQSGDGTTATATATATAIFKNIHFAKDFGAQWEIWDIFVQFQRNITFFNSSVSLCHLTFFELLYLLATQLNI